MDPEEIKRQYQLLLDEYHSNLIDWKTFESRLQVLKRSRFALDAEGQEETDEKTDGALASGISRFRLPSSVIRPHTIREHYDREKEFSEKHSEIRSPSAEETERKYGPPTKSGILRKSMVSDTVSPSSKSESTLKSSSDVLSEAESAKASEQQNSLESPIMTRRLLAGTILNGGYRLQRILGNGQCGQTWLAEETESGNFVVIKPIPFPIQRNAEAWAKFRNEFGKVQKFREPGICPVLRRVEDETVGCFTVSAFLDALPLDEYYERYYRAFGEFPVSATLRVLWPIAKVLDRAHRAKIVHKALKPQNILVGKNCGSMATDFSLTETVRLELFRLGVSTDAADAGPWRAPEAWLTETYTAQSDQFSLAAIAYQMISGQRPFSGKSEKEVREKIIYAEMPLLEDRSERINHALKRALSKEPGQRFSSCLHFLEELNEPDIHAPHYDKKEWQSNPRLGLWALLFGAPEPPDPAWLSENASEIWPFPDFESTLPSGESLVSGGASFPYQISPIGLATSSSVATFGPLTFLAGGLAAVATAAAVVVGVIGSSHESDASKTTTPPAQVRSHEELSVERNSETQISPNTTVEYSSNIVQHDEQVAPLKPEEINRMIRSATRGDLESQRRLGEIYLYGRGVDVDPKKAIEFLRLAANQNDAISLYHLGRCYELGLGLPKNRIQAVSTYREAALNGSREAREALARLRELSRTEDN